MHLDFKGRAARLAFSLALAAAMLIVLVPAGSDAAWDTLELVPSRYTQTNTYVPGEKMEIILHAGSGEVYDIIIAAGASGGQSLALFDDITIGTGGSTKVTYDVPANLPDGDYRADVLADHSSIGTLQESKRFRVQGYSFVIETDMQAYLGGDQVTIFWTANNLKDGSLASVGVGKLYVYDSAGATIADSDFSSPAGSYSFNLPVLSNTSLGYWIEGWFNDSATRPERVQNATKSFEVGHLGVIASLDRESYSVGGLVMVTVRTVITDSQDSPSATDPPAKGCSVTIQLYEKEMGLFKPRPDFVATMVTSSKGYAQHIFQLPATMAAGTELKITANATKGSHAWTDSEFFTVSGRSSLSVVLAFDRSEYTSGETIRANASVSQIGAPNGSAYTFVYEARDAQTGILLYRGTDTIGNATLTVSQDFEGVITFRVTVDDGRGNKASTERNLTITYARVFVNADVQYYRAGDTIRVTYAVVGKFQSPEIFYEVLDAEGAKVEEGKAGTGTFSFTVPKAPSSKYVIRAIATQSGRLTVGQTVIQQSSGFSVTLSFNRGAYAPGDTMAIDYRIVSLGNTPLPPHFRLTYGLANGMMMELQTDSPTGQLLYQVPSDIDEGSQAFILYSDSGGSTSEVIAIERDANPLWYNKVMGIPLTEYLLLLLIVILLVLHFRLRARLKRPHHEEHPRDEGRYEPRASVEQPRPSRERPREQRVVRSQSMAVNCEFCGQAIEITTSRRPIEVMCPSCGETQIVKK